MRKNSQHTKFFSMVIYDIMKTGQWNLIQSRVPTPSCKSSSSLAIEGLGFEKLAFLFVFLVFGIILSLVIILVEFKFPTRIHNKTIHQDIGDKHQEILEKRIRGLLKDSEKNEREHILKKLLWDEIWEK